MITSLEMARILGKSQESLFLPLTQSADTLVGSLGVGELFSLPPFQPTRADFENFACGRGGALPTGCQNISHSIGGGGANTRK